MIKYERMILRLAILNFLQYMFEICSDNYVRAKFAQRKSVVSPMNYHVIEARSRKVDRRIRRLLWKVAS